MDKILKYFGGDELASTVWFKKYKFGDEETPIDMNKRHVKEIAEKEYQRFAKTGFESYKMDKLSAYGKKRYTSLLFDDYDSIYEAIEINLKKHIGFFGTILGGSMLQGIGNHLLFSSLSNCFVVGRPYDSYAGISKKSDELVQVMKRRGGNGLDLSSIRPKGAIVHNQARFSSGPVLFAERYSNVTLEVAQDGRRGALMLTLFIEHPDVLDFIMSKQTNEKLTGANISVNISDEFMEAVENNDDYYLRFPVEASVEKVKNSLEWEYNKFNFVENVDNEEEFPLQYFVKIKAKEYWETIISCAHNSAEPGILFRGNWEKGGTDWVYPEYRPVSTNPCFTGEMELLTARGYKSFFNLDRECLQLKCDKCNRFPLVLVNKYGEHVPGKVWSNGLKHVITLVFENGKEIRCTPNHVFETQDDDEVQAKNLLGKFVKSFEGNDEAFEVIEIIDKGEQEEVFDFSLDNDCHWGVVNGLIAHNCSEIPMGPYDACRLVARNLLKLVNNPYTIDCSINENEVYEVFYEQLVIGDLIVDLELDYIARILNKIKCGDDPEDLKDSEIKLWEKIRETATAGRRIGSGFTALGDMLAALNLPYYSPKLIDRLFHIKMEAELDATIDMGILFGTFKGFDAELEKQAIYNQKVISIEFPEQYQRMLENGRRNISWSTAAPNGSGSIMTQTTSGIEPLFKPFYKRRKKCIDASERVDYIDPADGQKFTEFFVLHPQFIFWYIAGTVKTFTDAKICLENLPEDELNDLFKTSPWFGNTAEDLNWKQRVEIQAIVQKYTTHAISSTLNLPEDCEKALIGKIYLESWKSGLKGNTVYREGSRGGVLVSASTANEKTKMIDSNFTAIAAKRPKIIEGHYHTLKFRNKVYSVIIGLLDGRPREVFIISGIPNLPQVFDETSEHIVGEIVKDYSDWYNFTSKTFTVREINDVEGDEKMISLMISALMRYNAPMKHIIKTLDKTKPIAGSFTHRLNKILSQYAEAENNGEKCPTCGGEMKHDNGCVMCIDCGWSKC